MGFESAFKRSFLISNLDIEDQVRLAEEAKDGDPEARERIHAGLDKLVFNIAYKLLRSRGVDRDFLGDLYSLGHLGVDDAIQGYDSSKINEKTGKPISLTTYFTFWIRRNILKYLGDTSRLIRVPIYIQIEANKLLKATNILYGRLNREPTTEELADYSGIPPFKIELIQESTKKNDSLDLYNGSNPEIGLLEKFSYQSYESDSPIFPDDERFAEDYLRILQDFRVISKREAEVIEQRLSTNEEGEQTTHVEVGKAFGFTSSRAAAIYGRGISKIKNNPKALELLTLMAK